MPSPREPASTLLTAQHIDLLIRLARAELRVVEKERAGVSDENEALVEAFLERREAAWVTLAFCAEAAGFTRDPSFLPFLASMLGGGGEEKHGEDSDHEPTYRRHRGFRDRSFGQSVGRILAAAPPAMKEVARLARSDDMEVRYEVAKHLPLDDEAGVRLLEALATTDEWDRVRQVARDRLAAVREIAWWQGKFSRDPLSGLDPDGAERLRAPLETITQVLDLSVWKRRERLPELAGAIAQLPDAAAIDVLHMMLSKVNELRVIEPILLAQLVTRDRDGSALASLVQHWPGGMEGYYFLFMQCAQARPLAETTARRAVARRLFDEARRLSDCDHTDPAAVRAAAVMAALWPAEDDPTPILLALLAQRERCEDELGDDLSAAYWQLLSRADLDVTPLFARLSEAHLSNYPDAWHEAEGWWHTLLDRAATPTQLRELAARVLAEKTDLQDLAWALCRQIGLAHDPASDPAPIEILRRAWAQPHLRPAILTDHHLVRRALPLGRDDLRAGRLTYAEAAAVMETIATFWGGLAPLHYSSGITPEYEDEHRRKQLETYEAFLGPETLHGPPTEAEWAIFRALRDQALPSALDRRGWFHTIRVLPNGEWTASDRAALLRAMQAIRTEQSELASTLAAMLRTHPDEAWIPLMDELADIDPDEADTIRIWRDRIREAVDRQAAPNGSGAPANPAAPGGRAPPPVEWMDEPDDKP